jgi:hypothetical protein
MFANHKRHDKLLVVLAFDAADTLFWRQRPRPLAMVLEIRSLPTADCGSPRKQFLFLFFSPVLCPKCEGGSDRLFTALGSF